MKKRLFLLLNLMLLSAFYIIFISGYSIFTSDQLVYLLLPFRNIYPNFCPNDWFVWQTSHYHFSFSYLIRFIYFLFPGNFEFGIFILWVIFLVAFIHALYFLTISCNGNYKDFAVVVFLISFYSGSSLGQSHMYLSWLLPTCIGFMFTTYAFAFLLRKSYRIAFLFLGIGTLTHINFGVIGFPIFIIYMICNRDFYLKKVLICCAIFFLVACPTIYYIFVNFGKIDIPEGIRLAYFIRGSHHYDPTEFPNTEWIITLIPLFFSFFLCIFNKIFEHPFKLFAVLAGFLLFLGILEIANINLIFTKIYPWRFSPYLLIFSYLIISKQVIFKSYKFRLVFLLVLFMFLFYGSIHTPNYCGYGLNYYYLKGFFILFGITY